MKLTKVNVLLPSIFSLEQDIIKNYLKDEFVLLPSIFSLEQNFIFYFVFKSVVLLPSIFSLEQDMRKLNLHLIYNER